MIDLNNRQIDHLRISLTNKCNLDCFYCHKEGNDDTEQDMTKEHLFTILDSAKKAKINVIKFTGGEPLLRDDLIDILKYTSTLGFKEISLTTNGTLLEKNAVGLKKAGLNRINIGCDSLTGILPKTVEKLKKGIIATKKAELEIKLNMVILKGINEQQIPEMINFCIKNNVNLQLIELIELNNDNYEKYYSSLEPWEKILEKKADNIVVRDMQRRKRYFFDNIFVETVIPNKSFCEKCNKIRITSSGKIKQCLMKEKELVDFNNNSSIILACNTKGGYGYD